MNKIFSLVMLLLCQQIAFGQQHKMVITLSSGVSVPVGRFAETNRTGPGAALGLAFLLSEQTALGVNIGIDKFVKKKEVRFSEELFFIPITAGISKSFPNSNRWGYSVSGSYVLSTGAFDQEQMELTDKNGFGLNAGISYTLPTKVPLSVFSVFSWTKFTRYNYNNASFGISFPLFGICDCPR